MPASLWWSAIATFVCVALIWIMLRFRVEPMIIMALLLAVAMTSFAVFMIAEAKKDNTGARVEQLEVIVESMDRNQRDMQKRLRELERI